MPRKDSRAKQRSDAARLLEWRALARWQYLHPAVRALDPGVSWASDQYDGLIDNLIRAQIDQNAPPDRKEIETYIKRHLNGDQLKQLADFARRKAHLFPEGRPEASWDLYLVEDVEEQKRKHAGTGAGSVRAICEWLVKNVGRYRRRTAGTLRERYYAMKRSLT
jgi:hypothetical protein